MVTGVTSSMLPEALPLALAFLQLQLVSATCGEAFFEASTFETLESVSGASTVAKIDYWQPNEMDMHAAYVLNMSEVSASYCWSQGQR